MTKEDITMAIWGMELNSQICTTREQSERLLSLGLKKETADMTIHIKDDDGWYVTAEPFCEWEDDRNTFPSLVEPEPIVPAWSLHRLIKLVPIVVYSRPVLYLTTLGESVFYCTEDNNEEYEKSFSTYLNLFDNIIGCIEWLIKEGCISKEYIAI